MTNDDIAKPFYFRQLDKKDIIAYRKCRLKSLVAFPVSFCSKYETEVKKEELFFEVELKKESTRNILFGAFFDNVLIGICGLIYKEATNSGEIVQMYVNLKYQNKGIGKQMLHELIRHAKKEGKIEVLYLEVILNKTALINFYISSGFKLTSNKESDRKLFRMVL